MSEQIPIQESEVPHIENKEEAAGYAIKNYKKVVVLLLVGAFCFLLIIGGVLFLVKWSGSKIITPVITVEKNQPEAVKK